jgi:UDP-GlcNAc:undecaprenyl-phosphate GlcNAc-1-phosphate transferase
VSVGDAVLAFLVAFAIAVVVTPLTARLARAVGAVDQPKVRGLGEGGTPLLGGVAMLVAVVVGTLLFVDTGPVLSDRIDGILLGCCAIVLVGAVDDRFDLHPGFKLLGQIGAAWIPVSAGVEVGNVTLPFLGPIDLGGAGGPLTVAGLVVVMNVVNLSDGIDGLAAGVCAIAAVAFTIIAFDLGRDHAAVLAAVTAGAALGFLVHNFAPASVYMGDAGSNLLGLLLGCIAVEGAVKTNALLALVFPLVVLAVPFVDTTFVVLKRLKYRRKPWQADANHFHHRFSRIGFSQRRTVLYLYAWTFTVAGVAVALRFVPYSDEEGSLRLGGTLVMALLGLVALAASVYLVYVLEILKLKRLRQRWSRGEPEAVVDADVEHALQTGAFRALETGEFQAVRPSD